MSASKEAMPVGSFQVRVPVFCQCGWEGDVSELLAEDDEDTLYCPQCDTASWMWR